LDGHAGADSAHLFGTLHQFLSSPTLGCVEVFPATFTAERCECDDGNFTDGDGCSADCRVEQCFTCSGDPSVCTPLPSATACNDNNACTVSDHCQAGACGGP